MLERLSFILGGPLTADRWQVEAVVKDRKVYVGCRRCFAEQEPQDGQELPKEELPSGRRWLRQLEKLGIQRWRSRRAGGACAGPMWSVDAPPVEALQAKGGQAATPYHGPRGVS